MIIVSKVRKYRWGKGSDFLRTESATVSELVYTFQVQKQLASISCSYSYKPENIIFYTSFSYKQI